MKKEMEAVFFCILLFLLLPYLITVVVLGRKSCPISREITLEEYLPFVTASEISWEYSQEAIEAQTVIARGNFYFKWQNGEQEEMIRQASQSIKKREMSGENLKEFEKFQKAAEETKGKVLKMGDEIREIPFHALSQGKTRDGKEVLGEEYSYLPSTETPRDLESPSYVQGCYFTYKELEAAIKQKYPGFKLGENKTAEVKTMDSVGYVMEIQIGQQDFHGEEIKNLLQLPSSCFSIQTLGEEIRFLCKGVGHGMGFSQYTAQKMAEEGNSAEEILRYFFPEMQIGEIAEN